MLVLNLVFTFSFLVFAWFNLNDKDSWLWVPIYVAASGCCGLAAFGYVFPNLYLLLTAFYVIYAVVLYFAPDGVHDWIVKYKTPGIAESMKADKPYIEKTREFFGLLIISGALLLNYFAI